MSDIGVTVSLVQVALRILPDLVSANFGTLWLGLYLQTPAHNSKATPSHCVFRLLHNRGYRWTRLRLPSLSEYPQCWRRVLRGYRQLASGDARIAGRRAYPAGWPPMRSF